MTPASWTSQEGSSDRSTHRHRTGSLRTQRHPQQGHTRTLLSTSPCCPVFLLWFRPRLWDGSFGGSRWGAVGEGEEVGGQTRLISFQGVLGPMGPSGSKAQRPPEGAPRSAWLWPERSAPSSRPLRPLLHSGPPASGGRLGGRSQCWGLEEDSAWR